MKPNPPPSGIRYFDAHLHRQDPALRKALGDSPGFPDVSAQVSNGTHPDDWEDLKVLPDSHGTRVLKAYGVHPWKVDNLPDDWECRLRGYLRSGAASVGEIGLDHWIEVKDKTRQRDVFERQLAIAAELGLPPTIHCLRAWGQLIDCLKSGPGLPQGFLVHGFGGSREIMFQLLDLGAFLSFSAYAADPKRKRMRVAASACPVTRLLAETDAPDMVPPPEARRFPLHDKSGNALHHPLEISSAYALLAELRAEDVGRLAEQIQANFNRLFG